MLPFSSFSVTSFHLIFVRFSSNANHYIVQTIVLYFVLRNEFQKKNKLCS